jgi:hypothetical protein
MLNFSRPRLGSSSFLAAALVVAGAVSTAPGCGDGKSDEASAEAAQCASDRRFFEEKIWASFMGSKCVKCHTAEGEAPEKGARFILQTPSYPGFLDANLEMLRELAKVDIDGQSVLLVKPTGGANHGGKEQIESGGDEYKAMAELVKRLRAGGAGCDDKTKVTIQGVELLDARATFRKAALDLAGRLPTADEDKQISEQGEAVLDAALDLLMTEDTFSVRITEIYNDLFLTDKFLSYGGAALNFMEEDAEHYPWLAPYKDGDTDQYKSAERPLMNRAISREPLDLIAYVVKNDRSFSEVVTASYALVNPYSALAYGVKDKIQWNDPTAYNEFHETQVTFANGVSIPHAGVLSTPAFLNRWQTTPTNRNRARARRVFQFFLATDVLKLAERPVDASQVTQLDNPTRESQYCNVCHSVVDPVAGAFRGWDDNNYEVFDPVKNKWHDEMFPPGFGNKDNALPAEYYDRGVQWLGPQVAQDPRFVIAAMHTVYKGLTGHTPLAYPTDPQAKDYGAKLAAWQAQDAFFSETIAAFIKNNKNLKTIVKAVVKSPYYRGVSVKDGTSADEMAKHIDVGTGKLLSPEMLNRKLVAVTGVHWRKSWEYEKQHDWLGEDFELLYGGIDSDNVPTRLTEPNGITSAVAWRMANEVACEVTAYDFTLGKDQRRFFPKVDPIEAPELAGHTVDGSVASIKANIVHLHQLFLGETLDVADPEVERTYQLFLETWRELASRPDDKDIEWACRGRWLPESDTELPEEQRIDKDDNFTIRSWMAVVTYMLLDWKFLYELGQG